MATSKPRSKTAAETQSVVEVSKLVTTLLDDFSHSARQGQADLLTEPVMLLDLSTGCLDGCSQTLEIGWTALEDQILHHAPKPEVWNSHVRRSWWPIRWTPSANPSVPKMTV